MTRIANLAANNALVGYLLRTQSRLHETEIQIASEKISQTYAGIAENSERLVTIENTTNILRRYIADNETMELRYNIASTALEAMRTTVSGFKSTLNNFATAGITDRENIDNIQEAAFRALKDMQGYLNTTADGRYLFSGGRVTTKPVELNLSDIATFQATYDGATITYPTGRDGHVADFTITKDVVTEQTNWLTFARDDTTGPPPVGRITATSNGDFANVKVGSKITVSGTASNDGTYTVAAVDTTNSRWFQVVTEMLTDTTAAPDTGTPAGSITITTADETVLGTGSFTDLTFDRAAGTITAGAGTPFSGLSAGEAFTVANSEDAGNDGTYTIESVTSTVITIKQKKLTDEGAAGTTTLNLGPGVLTFTQNVGSDDRIAGAIGNFSNVTVGMQVTIAGTLGAFNDRDYTVRAVAADGSYIDVLEDVGATGLTDAGTTAIVTEAAGTITATSYYNGDHVSLTHRVDSNRDFAYDINASDPAFEKAIRAMSIIAQGAFATEGGLDKNSSRISEAMSLLDHALEATPSASLPNELTSNFESMQMNLGFNQVLLDVTNRNHEKFIGFLEQRIADAENIDPLTAITQLLDDSRALEASYQALARIRQLNLHDFLI